MNRKEINKTEFDSLTLTKIGHRFYGKEEEMIKFLTENGLLASIMRCSCGEMMRVANYSRSMDNQKVWRCPNQCCRKSQSLRTGSFFFNSKLKLWQIFGLTYVWSCAAGSSRGLSYVDIGRELEIGCPKTIVDWNQICKNICVDSVLIGENKFSAFWQTVWATYPCEPDHLAQDQNQLDVDESKKIKDQDKKKK